MSDTTQCEKCGKDWPWWLVSNMRWRASDPSPGMRCVICAPSIPKTDPTVRKLMAQVEEDVMVALRAELDQREAK